MRFICICLLVFLFFIKLTGFQHWQFVFDWASTYERKPTKCFCNFQFVLGKVQKFQIVFIFQYKQTQMSFIFVSFSCCGERHRWDITLYCVNLCLCLHKTQYKYFVLLLYLLWMTSFAWWVKTAIRKGISINFNAHCTNIWVHNLYIFVLYCLSLETHHSKLQNNSS